MCFLWLCSKQVFSTNVSSPPNGTEFPPVPCQFQAVHRAAQGLHGDSAAWVNPNNSLLVATESGAGKKIPLL